MEICGQFLFRQLMAIQPEGDLRAGLDGGQGAARDQGRRHAAARKLAQVARHSGDRDVSSFVSAAPLQPERQARSVGRSEEGPAFCLRLSAARSFITFEGPEGSGKSTQLRMLAARLREAGRDVLETAEPGGTPIGMQIRRVLLDAKNQELRPTTELLLMFAARAQNVDEWILPALSAGQIVLCDRFTDSTLVYQGVGARAGRGGGL